MKKITVDDLLDTRLQTIQFLRQQNLKSSYVMVFVCHDLKSSEYLMKLFNENPYYFKIFTLSKHQYKFVLGFENAEEELFQIIESQTLLSQFQGNKINMFTTGFFIENTLEINKSFLSYTDYPFSTNEN